MYICISIYTWIWISKAHHVHYDYFFYGRSRHVGHLRLLSKHKLLFLEYQNQVISQYDSFWGKVLVSSQDFLSLRCVPFMVVFDYKKKACPSSMWLSDGGLFCCLLDARFWCPHKNVFSGIPKTSHFPVWLFLKKGTHCHLRLPSSSPGRPIWVRGGLRSGHGMAEWRWWQRDDRWWPVVCRRGR